MANSIKLLSLSGSIRKESFNKKAAKAAAEIAASSGVSSNFIDLIDYPLPILNQDWEAAEGMPDNALKLKKLFNEHDAFIISSPEYNSSISALLKNTIDWLSRPDKSGEALEPFKGKTAAVIAASPGALGGLRGLVHLRAILTNLHVLVIPDQLAISSAFNAFDENGSLIDEKQQERLSNIVERLIEVSSALN